MIHGIPVRSAQPQDSDFPLGFRHLPRHLDAAQQAALLAEIRAVIARAPLFTPVMPRTGRPFSVAMTNCGPLGWCSDRDRGYRYEPRHPVTGRRWPPIPAMLLALWRALCDAETGPQACLVNYYRTGAKMGLHRDQDEEDFAAPILSVSLGDSGVFRIGGARRSDPTRSVTLQSGDVVVMGDAARRAYHGLDRILPGTSDLLSEGGRFNLTLRRVTVGGV